MSRQVNFYMSKDDQAELMRILFEAIPELLILKEETEVRELELIDKANLIYNFGSFFRVYFGRSQDLDKFVYEKPVQMTVAPFRVRHILDATQSPIVEFIPCWVSKSEDKILQINRGRLYYNTSYYELPNPELRIKDDSFVRFSERCFSIFKKNLKFDKDRGDYFGRGALRDELAGWRLC
jgi:predicted nucleotidyltransferase